MAPGFLFQDDAADVAAGRGEGSRPAIHSPLS